MTFLLNLFGGAVLRYAAIALAILLAVGFIRHDAAAPYKAEVRELRSAAEQKERLAAEDERRADAAEERNRHLEARLKEILDALPPGGATRFSPDELKRLRELAGA